MNTELGDVILERDFEAWDADGNRRPVKLRIGRPFQVTDSNGQIMWRCPFQVLGVGRERIEKAPGFDSVDATLNALLMVEHNFRSYIPRYAQRITWREMDDWNFFPPVVEISDEDFAQFLDDEDNPFRQAFDEFFKNFKPDNPAV
jgi:hypothetical protein